MGMRGSGIVWRAMEAARRKNLADAGEAPPVPGTFAMSRRAVLGAIAGMGIAAALPREARARNVGRVAIVGGGIAGLTALHHLTQAGVDATLYEARPRIGGRMFTQRPAGGVAFEAGGQLVNTDHDDMKALAATFGTALIDRKAEAHRTLVLEGSRRVADHELVAALQGIAARIGADADRLDRDRVRFGAALDRLSIRDYLDRHSRLIPARWARELLECTSRTEYGVEPGHASAIELIFNLPTVNGTRIEVLGGSDERYVIEGGSSALTDAIAARYERRIVRQKRLLRIDGRGGPARLSFLDGSSAMADAVIVAVPAPLMRQIHFGVPLPSAWRALIAELELGRNEKVQAAAATAAWSGVTGVGGEVWQTQDSGYASAWDGSVRDAGRVDPVWTWFLGGEQVAADGAADRTARRFAALSEAAIPGLAAATGQGPYRRTGWHRDPLTLGAYCNYAPGQLTRFARLLSIESEDPAAHRPSRAGNIYFAGEHLSDAYPGYMNGAAQTGRMAAEAIVGARLLAKAA
jgi:monoamine oxidase